MRISSSRHLKNWKPTPVSDFARYPYMLMNLGQRDHLVQVDNGPVMRANITPITRPPMNPPRGIFTSWGEITAAPGAHIVKVAASYWNGETEKANVPVLV